MRTERDIERTIDTYGNAVWRVCILYFGRSPDAQDAFQDTLLKYSLSETSFNDDEHRKAWLIRVATNVCKDMLKASHRKNTALAEESCGDLSSNPLDEPDSLFGDAIEALRSLPDPPRTPVYLSLYEGYSAGEIADMLDAPINTVYSWISRGRQRLREVLQ